MFEEKKLRALLQTLTINDKYGRLKTSKRGVKQMPWRWFDGCSVKVKNKIWLIFL